jgi:hypothetical protein
MTNSRSKVLLCCCVAGRLRLSNRSRFGLLNRKRAAIVDQIVTGCAPAASALSTIVW